MKVISCLLGIFVCLFTITAEENFILLHHNSDESVIEMGSKVDERLTPCSTFKIALSLIGYDSGILIDETNPVWHFQEDYDDFLESWKNPQDPYSWMKTSCLWFSKQITTRLGEEVFQSYLVALEYGNQDGSSSLTNAWIGGSLKISPREEAEFIQKILQKNLPVSPYALEMTKRLLFIEDLPHGWKLYGKTGWSGKTKKFDGINEVGWFVGWIENGDIAFPFAYNVINPEIDLSQRIPRVKQILGALSTH